jgi:transcriptional regulator with XRE-family HTH domain
MTAYKISPSSKGACMENPNTDARKPGERIARLRETHKLTREALAERSNIPVALLATIEDGGFMPDLAPLVKIARALGVRLGSFLDDSNELGPVISRADETKPTVRFSGSAGSQAAASTAAASTPGSLNFSALAAGKSGRHMEPFLIDLQASGQAAAKAPVPASSHEGEEFIHVLSGRVAILYGTDRHLLGAGDSIYYDSIVPHQVLAADDKPARILAVVYAPF